MSIEIGIDVGWSRRSRSCAVAVRGIAPTWGVQHSSTYANASVVVKLFRLDELVEWLPGFIADLGNRLARATLIVDGPLGLNGPPQANRYIDAACRTGGFYGRAFPNDVAGNGQQYVGATYRIVDPFLAIGQTNPWLGDASREGLIVAETHPTVGLAMLLPMLQLQDIPSHNRPFYVNGRPVKAKSDWYWMRGAGQIVADILDGNDVAAEDHHERRAALFCVAVAKRVSEGFAFAIGRAEPNEDGQGPGVYTLPAEVHSDWWEDVRRIGVRAIGQVRDRTRLIGVVHEALRNADGDDVPGNVLGGRDQAHGDPPFGTRQLVLRDNGGVWERHNPWLANYDGQVDVQALDDPGEQIRLRQAAGSGQWTSEPSALILAQARGFQGAHLNRTNTVIIPVQVP